MFASIFSAAQNRFHRTLQALDSFVLAFNYLVYTLRARFFCGGSYVRRVPAFDGYATIGCPGHDTVNIVENFGMDGTLLRAITRGRHVPDWNAVESDIENLECIVISAELHVVLSDSSDHVFDFTNLAYHFPDEANITPTDLVKLMLGKRVFAAKQDCFVEVMTVFRTITFLQHDVISSKTYAI